MDAARKYRSELDAEELARARPRLETGSSFNGLDKILRFSPPGREPGEEARDNGQGLSARDITHALDLVHEAAQTIKVAEERAREGEARTQALLQRATEELKSAEARFQGAEARARAAETRAQEAETRARDAENWLRQIFTTISEELPQRR